MDEAEYQVGDLVRVTPHDERAPYDALVVGNAGGRLSVRPRDAIRVIYDVGHDRVTLIDPRQKRLRKSRT